MKRLVVGGLAALGLIGCKSAVSGQPTVTAPQPSDFAVDVAVVSYTPLIARKVPLLVRRFGALAASRRAAVGYDHRDLPHRRGELTSFPTGDVQFSAAFGARAQTYTFPVRRLVVAREGMNLTGTAIKVVL
jgi:hypothetical protein